MKVLVINCGSSSLKYQLIDSETEAVLAKGLCERIGIDGALTYQKAGEEKEKSTPAMPTHKEAIQLVLDALVNPKTGAIKDLSEVEAVGHRIVHGGEKFASSAVINEEMIKAVEECNDLAPLHNPANLIGIRACQELMPGVPMVGVFDTAFHQTMPEKAYLYGLPYEYYEKYKVRRYGFHGTSHSFVSKHFAEFAGLDLNHSKIIVAHLGNGASVSAVVDGKCVDTSMGLTPLEGLVMGTRSGDIDPAIMEFIANKENLDIAGVMNVLNKKSGVQGISKVSSDFRDLEEGMEAGNKLCAAAIEVFSYRVAKYIGAYVAAMNGVDGIAFTAGIGENAPLVREKVVSYLGYLGITLDQEANGHRGEDLMISTADSKVKVAIIPTNEELAICRETAALVK
ncbi:MAG: acetate kinase [Lachnospiraceae bacterium]|jgi:acetate kinase|uniref:acetate/propionate family kinase n=1 Tax=Clostridium sp. (strain SY8519) TaxID=1042156 RepID=UPI00021719EC|nr:acetate kinase [Clostridium sp. SY8519]MCI1654863.1 acetate kinase [Lachnospiraceae bacterium]MCI1657261.1 acetate kinase [Lachnospiraceae bacterium]MCI2195703.1 acetate kinase [Lachnospiraceae bacterium]BAK48030.1 acetate kinase [Clostridium sp. SY8519]HAD19682.1 acetate kinase [Lachnospiraceae bacterium]